MTDKEKIEQCFKEILSNKKVMFKDEKYDHYDLIAIRFQNQNNGDINDTWFTFNKSGDLIDMY